MKKMMIALLVVASIFVLASCAQAPISSSLSLTSKDMVADSANASAIIAEGSKAYTKDSSGAYTEITTKALTYGTLKVENTAITGSSQDSWKFTYTGAEGKDGSETALTVYIGVLNTDGKSFKTQCATVTVNAEAVWTGSTAVAVALNTTTTTAAKTFAVAGDKIYVDGKEYSAAVDVKSASDAKIGTLAAELTVEKTGIKFTFTDALPTTDDSVAGKSIKVEVKNGTTVVATYNVTCSHVGTPAPKDVVVLSAEADADKAVTASIALSTEETYVKVYVVKSSGKEDPQGDVSVKASEDDEIEFNVEDDSLLLADSVVGKIYLKAEGDKTKLTGIKFTLDTMAMKLGAAYDEFVLRFKDSKNNVLANCTVKATVSAKEFSVNSVVGKTAVATGNSYSLYDAEEEAWILIAESVSKAYVSNEDNDFCGTLVKGTTANTIKFSTATVTDGGKTYTPKCGKGSAIIGINVNSANGLAEGMFVLNYENVEVTGSKEVTSSADDDGSFEIEGGKNCSIYVREISESATSKKMIWEDEWSDSEAAPKFYGLNSNGRFEVGNFTYTAKTSIFKCYFNGQGVSTGYKKTGYIQIAVVDNLTDEVLSTYEITGYNGWTATEE